MRRKINASELPAFDPAEHIEDEKDVAACLAVVLEENDPAALAHALGVKLVAEPV